MAINSQTLRKYEPKEAEFREKKHITTDPVCGMKVKPEEAKGKAEYQDQIFYFCSEEHEKEFLKNPEKYVSKMKQEKPVEHELHHQ
ncbi:MAG: YHS domain-containing protein [Candidatus Jordarchaeum sp.]|uniref:YHS domain-containing protein n=1 Tax=Candidatus Jordarchaeum sp. TaxID=2823881 RepID=UPI00404ACF84